MSFFFVNSQEDKMGNWGRDVEVTEITNDLLLVTACDSCGAIGSKDLDIVKVPPDLVGRLTTRVALLEVLSAGSEPRVVTVAISSEPDPTGNRILEGVKQELGSAGFNNLPLVISTEKNIPTSQTGLGIGISGVCAKNDLRLGLSCPGDYVYCLGRPKVGNEITSADDPEIVNAGDIVKLQNSNGVHDIIPVGSQGIQGEIIRLSNHMKLDFKGQRQDRIDLKKSAGPSTCVLFTCSEKQVSNQFNGRLLSEIGVFNPDQM
jgi:hypothetical protein